MGCLGLTGLRTEGTLSSLLCFILGCVGLNGLKTVFFSVDWVGLRTPLLDIGLVGLVTSCAGSLVGLVSSFLVGLTGLTTAVSSPFLYAVDWLGLNSPFFQTGCVGLSFGTSFLVLVFVGLVGLRAETFLVD